jgi:uncharacterized membrane protein
MQGLLGPILSKAPSWGIWLILTLVLVAPIYYLMKRLGFSDPPPDERTLARNALERLLTAGEEVPEVPAKAPRLR